MKLLSRKLSYQEKGFYGSLGHSSIPVQFSETSLNYSNQSIRGEIALPLQHKMRVESRLIIPQYGFADTKCPTLKAGAIGEQ